MHSSVPNLQVLDTPNSQSSEMEEPWFTQKFQNLAMRNQPNNNTQLVLPWIILSVGNSQDPKVTPKLTISLKFAVKKTKLLLKPNTYEIFFHVTTINTYIKDTYSTEFCLKPNTYTTCTFIRAKTELHTFRPKIRPKTAVVYR